MGTPQFITEAQLRQNFSLCHGSEVHLPEGTRLTPSAAQLLSERKIRVRYKDDLGRVFIPGPDGTEGSLQQVNPLTGGNRRPENICALCHGHVDKKTELLTLLDNEQLVPKTHPRIVLRGKLDSLIAQTVVVQTEFEQCSSALLRASLADLRSYMGNILRCEVTGEALAPISMHEMNEETLHAVSHQPLKYLGHDHVVPEVGHGYKAALLNQLRALAREAEIVAAKTFSCATYGLSRGDIVQGLNRLSSALYVLMIMTIMNDSHAEDSRLRGINNEPG